MVSVSRSLAFLAAFALGSSDALSTPAIIGREQPYAYAVNATARLPAQQTIAVAGAKFITVHFSQFRLATGDVVSLSDAKGNVVAEYSGLGRGDLGDKGGFYSTQIFSDKVTLQYRPSPQSVAGATSDYGFAIDKVVRSSSSGSVSSVCNANQMQPPKCYVNDPLVPQAYTKTQAVARLVFGDRSCTGWLVGSEGHLITNHHCMESQDVASNTQYEFMAESPSCDDECVTVGSCRGTIAATTATFLHADETLDYAIVKLNAVVDLSQFGFLKLRVAGGVEKEQIYIPQHPGGRAKTIAVTVDGGDVARATMGASDTCGAYRVAYTADTEKGSSGSPIIAAKDNAVIGLHSCGAPATGACINSALDVRTLIFELQKLNLVPRNALDDPTAQLASGPWIPSTPAPTSPTPAPTPLDTCPGWRSQSTCEVFTKGKCVWTGTKCVKPSRL